MAWSQPSYLIVTLKFFHIPVQTFCSSKVVHFAGSHSNTCATHTHTHTPYSQLSIYDLCTYPYSYKLVKLPPNITSHKDLSFLKASSVFQALLGTRCTRGQYSTMEGVECELDSVDVRAERRKAHISGVEEGGDEMTEEIIEGPRGNSLI